MPTYRATYASIGRAPMVSAYACRCPLKNPHCPACSPVECAGGTYNDKREVALFEFVHQLRKYLAADRIDHSWAIRT